MDSRRFEQTVVWHCAPALAGLKPACVMSLSAEEFPELPRLAGQYNARMGEDGPRFLVLCRCPRGALLLVYREALLRRALDQPGARAILKVTGYPVGASLPMMLRCLIRRLEESEGFPHEIGLFLGYPPEDVEGFLTDVDGTRCKLRGDWKVYHDVEGAKRRFAQFRRCRDQLWARLERGFTLSQLFGGARARTA